MKEVNKSLSVEVDVINPSTGETIKVNGTHTETTKYYSIRKITSRIDTMTLLEIMSKTTKSPKDIEVLNYLLSMADRYNEIRLNSISGLAKELKIGRTKITILLKSFEDEDFFKKLDKGVYFVNPFIWVGRKCNSNKLREEAQIRWKET